MGGNGEKTDRHLLGLYVHIPFCRSKCAYCDFVSWPNRLGAVDAYLDALDGELAFWAEKLKSYRIVSVFLGGGTPSLLTGNQIARLLGRIFDTVDMAADVEITMEANPGTVQEASLREYRRAGVNRLSLGIQAAQDRLLRKLGRIHTLAEGERAVMMARESGFDNLSLDLMYGLPEQDLSDWRETLSWATSQAPQHISAYSLILETGTPLAERVQKGLESLPDEDSVLQMQRTATEYLRSHGFARYEISNYARPGMRCRHNIIYWKRGAYLGLGCAAHSFFEGERFSNPDTFEEYLAGQRLLNRERICEADAMEETIMLETRMTEGLNLEAFNKTFGKDLRILRDKEIVRLRELGLMQIHSEHLYLTERGLELQNAVVAELIAGGFE